jgi:hypothetical protein
LERVTALPIIVKHPEPPSPSRSWYLGTDPGSVPRSIGWVGFPSRAQAFPDEAAARAALEAAYPGYADAAGLLFLDLVEELLLWQDPRL